MQPPNFMQDDLQSQNMTSPFQIKPSRDSLSQFNSIPVSPYNQVQSPGSRMGYMGQMPFQEFQDYQQYQQAFQTQQQFGGQ